MDHRHENASRKMLMSDFAQLPPVLATSLLVGMSIVERHNSGLRGFALIGQKSFRKYYDGHQAGQRRIHECV